MFSLIFLLGLAGWFGSHSLDWSCAGADPARQCGALSPSAALVPGQDISPRNGVRFGVDFNAVREAQHEALRRAD